MKIVYWPDGCWCDQDEIHQMTHKSDDFAVLEIPDDVHYEDHQIDSMVQDLISS